MRNKSIKKETWRKVNAFVSLWHNMHGNISRYCISLFHTISILPEQLTVQSSKSGHFLRFNEVVKRTNLLEKCSIALLQTQFFLSPTLFLIWTVSFKQASQYERLVSRFKIKIEINCIVDSSLNGSFFHSLSNFTIIPIAIYIEWSRGASWGLDEMRFGFCLRRVHHPSILFDCADCGHYSKNNFIYLSCW